MLRDEFRLVVVVVIFIEVYGWKYIITGEFASLYLLQWHFEVAVKSTEQCLSVSCHWLAQIYI